MEEFLYLPFSFMMCYFGGKGWNSQTDEETDRRTDGQTTNRQTDGQADRQAGRQAGGRTDTWHLPYFVILFEVVF